MNPKLMTTEGMFRCPRTNVQMKLVGFAFTSCIPGLDLKKLEPKIANDCRWNNKGNS